MKYLKMLFVIICLLILLNAIINGRDLFYVIVPWILLASVFIVDLAQNEDLFFKQYEFKNPITMYWNEYAGVYICEVVDAPEYSASGKTRKEALKNLERLITELQEYGD